MEGCYRFDLPSCQIGSVDVEDLDRLCIFDQDTRSSRRDESFVDFIPGNENHFEERAFGYCTEERWLTCTANNCPLYDPPAYFNSETILPCSKDFNRCNPYEYCFGINPDVIINADVDLEDYLYVVLMIYYFKII